MVMITVDDTGEKKTRSKTGREGTGIAAMGFMEKHDIAIQIGRDALGKVVQLFVRLSRPMVQAMLDSGDEFYMRFRRYIERM